MLSSDPDIQWVYSPSWRCPVGILVRNGDSVTSHIGREFATRAVPHLPSAGRADPWAPLLSEQAGGSRALSSCSQSPPGEPVLGQRRGTCPTPPHPLSSAPWVFQPAGQGSPSTQRRARPCTALASTRSATGQRDPLSGELPLSCEEAAGKPGTGPTSFQIQGTRWPPRGVEYFRWRWSQEAPNVPPCEIRRKC